MVDGTDSFFPSTGRASGRLSAQRAQRRVEAVLVNATGPGTWRFELGTTASLEPGSLRVIAGEIALETEDALVFRLSGKPGERVVFSFRTRR